jgi:hypothetical protein
MQKERESTTNGRHPVRNTGAAVVGAIQGIKEGLQEEHLGDESVRAARNIGEMTRAVRREGREQWESPEIQRLRGEMRSGTDKAIVKSSNAASDATSAVRQRRQRLAHQMRETTHDMQETTGQMVRAGMHRAQAVATTTRRAAHAPRHIKKDLGAAKDSYKQSLTTSLATYAVLAALGTTAFILLTSGLVVAFNLLLGVPAGWFITFGLYAIVGAGAYFLGRRRGKDKRQEAREHVQDARREVRYVARPVQEAFTKNQEVRT